jgi:hypothetical protein
MLLCLYSSCTQRCTCAARVSTIYRGLKGVQRIYKLYIYCAVLKRLATPSDFHIPLPSTVPSAHSETSFTHGCIYSPLNSYNSLVLVEYNCVRLTADCLQYFKFTGEYKNLQLLNFTFYRLTCTARRCWTCSCSHCMLCVTGASWCLSQN